MRLLKFLEGLCFPLDTLPDLGSVGTVSIFTGKSSSWSDLGETRDPRSMELQALDRWLSLLVVNSGTIGLKHWLRRGDVKSDENILLWVILVTFNSLSSPLVEKNSSWVLFRLNLGLSVATSKYSSGQLTGVLSIPISFSSLSVIILR
jgi:hypothetical protein